MPSFMGRECIITAMPAEVHYDGGSEADRKRLTMVRIMSVPSSNG